jgi:beta-exotoxin I transport system ATP-binding protein
VACRPAASPRAERLTAAIETEGLTKLYGPERGIADVTMAVEPGEVFGFLGPNGAGKTTTIRTLLDLLHPTRGSARIFGLHSRRDSVAIRARLGNLPGDFGFGKRTSGREALALLARLRGIDGLGRAEELARRFRADLERPLGRLSRGNRQKVGLILAVFHRPELLILDEPTSGLDPLMQEEFLALVGEERERGCAVFISSHELDEVERVCDRVGIIRDGRLIAVERVADLLGRTQRRNRVEVEFAEPADLEAVRAMPGVVGAEYVHPTLEEVFLTYYEERGESGEGEAG